MNKLNKNIFTDRWDSDCFPDKETALRICKDTKILTKYIPHPFSGHRPLPNLKLSTIETNENGWRSPSVINKKFKKNIILLGGSAAWGFGATSNKQICLPAVQLLQVLHGAEQPVATRDVVPSSCWPHAEPAQHLSASSSLTHGSAKQSIVSGLSFNPFAPLFASGTTQNAVVPVIVSHFAGVLAQ